MQQTHRRLILWLFCGEKGGTKAVYICNRDRDRWIGVSCMSKGICTNSVRKLSTALA